MEDAERFWFTRFQIDQDDRSDAEIVWTDARPTPKPVRQPTAHERFSILLVGGLAIALLIGMVVTLVIGVYVSR